MRDEEIDALLLDEIMARWPCVLRVFIDWHLHCIVCPITSFHTLADSAAAHGYPVEQLATEANWRIIAYGERDVSSRQFQYVPSNRDLFEKVASPKRVEKKILNIVEEWLEPFAESGDTTAYFSKRAPVELMHFHKTDSLLYKADMKVFETAKAWKRYGEAAGFGAPRFSWNNARELREIARNHMMYVDPPQMAVNAIAMAKRADELEPGYENKIIIARLYLKTGDKAQAKQWAEMARQIAVSSGFDTKQADAVLDQLKS